MSNFVGNLLLTSVICSTIVLIIFAVSPLLNKYTKKWRYVVFILIAIKLLIPMPLYTAENAIVIPMARETSSTIINGTNNEANKNEANIEAEKDAVNQNNQQAVDTANNSTQVENVKNNTVANNSNQTVTSGSIKSESSSNALTSFISNIDLDMFYMALFIVWCVGAAGFSFYYIVMYFYHRKTLNRWSSNISDENILAMLEEEKERLGITKNIVLKKCKKINTPMTLGFRHLSIVLPYTEYNQESIRYIFRHELTHQKRHDIYTKVLFIATKCFHWFNPIIPKMVNRAYDDMEILCDDMVVADMQQEQRIQYNETILSIAKSKAEEITGKNILFAFCFVEKESNLKERVKNIMIMGKRKKGYQIVALAIAVIVAGSCFISCGVSKEKTAKDIYNEYLKETLIPEYGLADLSEFSATIEATQNNNYYITDRKINLGGIASVYVDDMNNDSVEDMIVVRYEKGTGIQKSDVRFGMILAAYTIQDGQITLLDEIKVRAPYDDIGDGVLHREYISEKESAERNVYVNAITDGTNKYIMVESNEWVQVFADGHYQYNVVYELDGNKLNTKYSFGQTEGGSAGFEFTGYYDSTGVLLWNEYAGQEGEEPGRYETFEEALVGFYSNLGINVQASVEENTTYLVNSVIKEESLVNNIFSYNWILEEYNADENGTWARFIQNAKDFTGVLKVADVSAEDIAKKTVSGTSKEAMEVFEKIQNDESYAGHIFLAASLLNKNYSEEIDDKVYYYWKSIGTVLAATGIDYSFEGYDFKFVNDAETEQIYYVIEPKVVECIGKALSGTVWPATAIPYDDPEFAKAEPGTYTYPYEITYIEDEDKYYVRFGEHGSIYFTDCTYKVNDNDTMTITGKYTNSESNPDEYLIATYEITVGYDPDNEIYGFTILDIKEI